MIRGCCERCHVAFERRSGSRDSGRFCSRKCADIALREVRRERLMDMVAPKMERARVNREAIARGRALPQAECRVCEGPVYYPRRVLCGPECQRVWELRDAIAHQRRRKKVRKCACRDCGAAFMNHYGNKRRLFCSEACARRYGRRLAKAGRRARQRGAQSEPVDPMIVFRRDKWMCRLCGGKAPSTLRGSRHPQAPEIDHIVPLSRGGEHSYANTQCAHRRCNAAKGSRVVGQLRLVG
jgi:5-methylcytosine-specific restriction endonuclease McrA